MIMLLDLNTHETPTGWWIEVKYENGWGRHTRSHDRQWAGDMAKFLLGKYPETRVIPNQITENTPGVAATAKTSAGEICISAQARHGLKASGRLPVDRKRVGLQTERLHQSNRKTGYALAGDNRQVLRPLF